MAFPVEGWSGSAAVELSQIADDASVEGRVVSTDAATAQAQALRSVSLDHDGREWAAVGMRETQSVDVVFSGAAALPVGSDTAARWLAWYSRTLQMT